jgi:protocatechuate 3,4-dioxygenase beta subunit
MRHMKFKLSLIILLLTFSYFLSAQDVQKITELNQQLRNGNTSISKILSEQSLMGLHSLTPFREMIRNNAKAETITIVTPNESGSKILVRGTITDAKGKPINNGLVYVYQTSDKGWYSDTGAHVLMNEGDRRHARLFGYFKTDANGNFSFNTIMPKGYPRSDLPAHIHLELTANEGSGLVTELLFEEDPRLVGQIRQNAIREKFYISKNTGTADSPLYIYQLTTRD